ncbi:4-hydroxybenzoate octaprenyltransferase [Carnimonas nigrificans]|uniref:4-hydroxybenzoate octaprenyltransferase n=1 Tax=Carnimonas nigrificans TaxID=64323 RepID=UPI00047256EC|nr:4-hydroxybenzoate octaprenyltransferase [Carnimonas nigrificans]
MTANSALWQRICHRIPDFLRLMRLDRPIGTWLLMWPTMSALWLASGGLPPLSLLLIFIAGVYCMRAAGCVINDFADRKLDGHVKRTKSRPLATGRIASWEALLLFAGLIFVAFVLVCFTNAATVLLSFVAVALAACYPFMKRYTHLPQVVLGAAYSWGIPMAFMAVNQTIPSAAWWLFIANVVWTLMYDTEYAMVDRDDDLNVGIKSTAILFGRMDLTILALLKVIVLVLLTGLGVHFMLGFFFWLALLGILALFVYQQFLVRQRARDDCFKAFLNNHWVGVLLFSGVVLSLWPY